MKKFKDLFEARKPSDDNFGGAGYGGERGFKNKAVASRGGQTAGRNRRDAAMRKAQEGMVAAALKQDEKEFRKHAKIWAKGMSSMTGNKPLIQRMWTKEKAKAFKDGSWFKMGLKKQKELDPGPRWESVANGTVGKIGVKAVELEEAEYKGRKVTLNDPFRSNDGKKKFYVYVKNDKGNIIKLGFGDPNMEIKRDDPERRKSFRARHGCDNPGPKWKARYWSCYQWRASAKVDN